jgi:EF-P beta-lysylation protein EpmB
MLQVTGFSGVPFREPAPGPEAHPSIGVQVSRQGEAPGSQEAWKRALAEAVRDPDELLALLRLPESLRPGTRAAARRFPLVVPRGFVARMRPEDPRDPLLRQVLPIAEEEERTEGTTKDPVGDGEATVAPGLIKKYAGRALLVATGSCAIHCRYCFRRHFPYDEVPRGLPAWEPALRALRADGSIREAILSGGDPLLLADEPLGRLVRALEAIPHLERLRLHTRLPVVIPERVTDGLIALLREGRLTPIVVVHANHPAELEGGCPGALARLVEAGIPVLNQAVLLRGVNDGVDALARLCERLVSLRVIPYYLHQLDPVEGAAHFAVEEERGLRIVAELERRLPGYAVPRYVREVPGAPSKTRLLP